MNKLFNKIAAGVVGLAMAVGVGVAIGSQSKAEARSVKAEDEVFYTLTPASTGGNSTPHNNYTAAATTTIDGVGWSVTGNSNMVPWRIGGKSISGVDRDVYSTTAMGSAITKVELTVGAASSITVNSLKLIVGNSGFASTTDTVTRSFTANSTITFVPTSGTSWATGQYYKFVFNVTVSGSSNKFVAFTGAKFYRAKSETSNYTVTYNGNGATSGTVPTDSHSYSSSDSTVTVLGNTGNLAKTGFTFAGWNTQADGEGSHYVAGGTFTISENTTLYAEWSINQHTLTYNANGGSGTLPEGGTYDYGTKVDVGSGDGLTNGDLVFAGWNTSADGTGDTYLEGSKVTIEGDTVLYAKWSEAGTTLTRVEDAADLSVGDQIAIVSAISDTSNQYALSTTQNNNNRGAVSVTVSASYTFEAIADVQMITLGKSNDNWTFDVGNGYLYAASSSNNYLRTESSLDDNHNGEWTISIADGVATITAQGSNTRNLLKYNSGSTCFSCYASGQISVSIYKSGEPGKVLESISIDGNFSKTEFNVGESWADAKTGLSVIGHYSDDTTAEITSDISWSYNPSASVPGVTSLTVTATVGSLTATHTETVSVVVPESPYTNGIEYKMYFYNSNKSCDNYFTGEMSGYYGATSTTKSEGVDVLFEANGNGQNIYFMDGSTKNYITVAISGTFINFVYSSTVPTTPWYYNGEYIVYVIDSSVYTLGNYGSYTNFGAYASYQSSNYHVKFALSATLTADDFATHFLSDLTCDSTGTTRPVGSWSALEALYNELESTEQAKLQNTSDQSQNIVSAMERYDYIVGKYGTSVYKDFIGRNPASIGSGRIAFFGNLNDEQSGTAIAITVASILSVAALGGYFFIKKKKVTK